MTVTVEMLPITSIGTKDRLRHDDHGYVDAIAASVQRAALQGVGYEGLRSPIEVRKEEKGYLLISGLHRWFALNKLERDTIAAIVLDVDEIEAKLLEVEENLVRRDLGALDRAFFVLRFREMFEAAYGAVSVGRPKREDVENAGENNTDKLSVFSEHAEDRLGLNERSIQRSLRIANGLAEESVDLLRGTKWAENQSALLELAGVPVERQGDVIGMLLDEDNSITSVRDAIAHLEGVAKPDASEAVFRKWLGIAGLKKPLKKRLLKEWMGRDLTLFKEVAREMGVTITPSEEG